MDFTPASQNGIIPPSETLTLQSRLGLAASSTSTIFGNELVLKAISDASMYKTEPVTFYRRVGSTGTAVSIGTGTWINTNTSVLVTSAINTGTYQLYASWPGEGLYAPQSTIQTPLAYEVRAGFPLGATISHSVSPASDTIVTGEGTATFTVTVSTATQLTDTLSFYVGNVFYGQASWVNNVATLAISNLPAGNLTVKTIWPGATIGGTPYEGFTYNISYVVKAGTDLNSPLVLFANPSTEIVNEGNIVLVSQINTTTEINVGEISYFINGDSVGIDTTVVSNISSLPVTTNLAVGSYTVNATWDGNQSSHPRYIPITSNNFTLTILARDTATLSLTDSPDPSLLNRQGVTLTATLNTAKNPIGTVTFINDTTTLGVVPLVDRVAVFTATNLTTGTFNIRALYSGSGLVPKFNSTSSAVIQTTVVAALPYPGTFTLTGPTNFHRISGPRTYTITGSVNTLTEGLVTLNAINSVAELLTTATTTLAPTVDLIGPDQAINTGTSVSIFGITTTTTLVFNPITNQIESRPTTITDRIIVVRSYSQPFIANATITNGYLYGNSNSRVRVYTDGKYLKIGGTFTANGTGGQVYTITDIVGSTPDFIVYYTPPRDNSTFEVTGPDAVAFVMYLTGQVVSRTTVLSRSTTTSIQNTFLSTPLSTATFTGTAVQTLTFDPQIISTGTLYLQAVWSGQDRLTDGYTPFVGTASNVLTATIVQPTISLAASTGTNSISNANTFTISVNTSSVIANTVRLYNSSTVIATSAIPANTSSIQITVPPGLLTQPIFGPFNVPSKNITAALDQVNYSTTSSVNVFTDESVITSTFTATNQNGTLNTTVYSVLSKIVNPENPFWKLRVSPRFATPIQNLYFPTTITISSATDSYSVVAELTTTNVTTASNSVSIRVVPQSQPSLTITAPATSRYFNDNGTTNTDSVSVGVAIVQTGTNYTPAGTLTLFANNQIVSTASVTTSTINFSLAPSQYGTGGTAVNIRAVYSGFNFLLPSSATSIITLVKNTPQLAVGNKSLITGGGNQGQYFGPVDLTATFPVTTSAPAFVNWYRNSIFINNTPVVNGVANLNNAVLPTGNNAITVTYDQTDIYTGGSTALSVVQAASPITISNITTSQLGIPLSEPYKWQLRATYFIYNGDPAITNATSIVSRYYVGTKEPNPTITTIPLSGENQLICQIPNANSRFYERCDLTIKVGNTILYSAEISGSS